MDRGKKAAGVRQEEIDRLWLGVSQRLAAAVAHELRNALNGVAVNLEVVRSRSGREGVPAATLGSFANSASEQLEQVITVTEALVNLGRPAREPAAVGRCADQVATLLRAPLAANGGALDLTVEGEGTTRAPADAVRLFVAAAMQAAADGTRGDGAGLRCRVRPADGVELAIEGSFTTPPRLAPDVERAARELGVGVQSAASGITLTFPA